jgi:hypothetical protein
VARIVITIHPSVSDARLLTVSDAMLQVLDSIKLLEEAQQGMGFPQDKLVWKLERASTNTPFTIVALAQSSHPTADHALVDYAADMVQKEVAKCMRSIVDREQPPAWMTPGALSVARNIFARNMNGVGATDYDFDKGRVLSIKPEDAARAVGALEAFNVLAFQDLDARVSFGEIEGLMIAAGRYRNKPAIQIRNDLYGFIWCVLPVQLLESFGGEHRMSDVWAGKTIGASGRLYYAAGGAKISYIDALDMREIETAPSVRLEDVLDPDFTGGMDPHGYLDKLHEGSLA